MINNTAINTLCPLRVADLAPTACNAEPTQSGATTTLPALTDTANLIAQQAMKTAKWITVIGGRREHIEVLAAAGVSRSRIRWVQGRDQDQREWATEQALLAGTSSVVVSWLGELSPRTNQRLKLAGRASQTLSFVFPDMVRPDPLH